MRAYIPSVRGRYRTNFTPYSESSYLWGFILVLYLVIAFFGQGICPYVGQNVSFVKHYLKKRYGDPKTNSSFPWYPLYTQVIKSLTTGDTARTKLARRRLVGIRTKYKISALDGVCWQFVVSGWLEIENISADVWRHFRSHITYVYNSTCKRFGVSVSRLLKSRLS